MDEKLLQALANELAKISKPLTISGSSIASWRKSALRRL
ncbi:transposase [Pantoea ananatis]|nr:transposase [Pantoea ananatis]